MFFDKKKFAKLLADAKGNRSINGYGNEVKVDPGYISRLLREKIGTPPGPGVIKKLAAGASSGVTYEELMVAAGHLREPAWTGIYSQKDRFEQKVAEALQKPLAEFLPVKNIPLVNFKYDQGLKADNVVGYINVPRELEADFALTVKDLSMVEAGIFPGDVAVCRKAANEPVTGKMIVTRVSGRDIGVRYLINESGVYKLKAANSLVPKQIVSKPEVIGYVLLIQKKALSYQNYEELREKDRDEVITESFLLEKLAESSGLPPAEIKKALDSLKKKNG